jgi:hypothetical protein
MKVPTLRNAALLPRFSHTGEIATLDEMLGLYFQPRAPRDELPGGGEYLMNVTGAAGFYIKAFLSEGLVDPRVAAETFPFDRPRLRADRAPLDVTSPDPPTALAVEPADDGVRLTWTGASDDTGVVDYVVRRDGAVMGYATETSFFDAGGSGSALYTVTARDAPGNESEPALSR